MEITELKKHINHGKTTQLKKAVKFAVKNNLTELAEDIYKTFLVIKDKPKKWALQVELINALRKLDYKGIIDDLKEIIEVDKAHDLVTIKATTAYITLVRRDVNDLSLVIELLDKGISVVTGALESLVIEAGSPSEEDIHKIFSKTKDINKHPQRIGREFGLIDPRIYLAIAAHYWQTEEKESFLNYCMETAYNIDQFGKEIPNIQLKKVCENSLNGKPTKGYIL